MDASSSAAPSRRTQARVSTGSLFDSDSEDDEKRQGLRGHREDGLPSARQLSSKKAIPAPEADAETKVAGSRPAVVTPGNASSPLSQSERKELEWYRAHSHALQADALRTPQIPEESARWDPRAAAVNSSASCLRRSASASPGQKTVVHTYVAASEESSTPRACQGRSAFDFGARSIARLSGEGAAAYQAADPERDDVPASLGVKFASRSSSTSSLARKKSEAQQRLGDMRQSSSSRPSHAPPQPAGKDVSISLAETQEPEKAHVSWEEGAQRRSRSRRQSNSPVQKAKRAAARESVYHPSELLQEHIKRLEELDQEEGHEQDKALCSPIPPPELALTTRDLNNLGLQIHSRIFEHPGRCMALVTGLHEPTKEAVKETFKSAHKLLDKIVCAILRNDTASARSALGRLKKEMWEAIERFEHKAYQQSSCYEEDAVRRRLGETKKAAEDFEIEKLVFSSAEEAIAGRRKRQECERQRQLEAGMQELSREMQKFKVMVHTLACLPWEEGEQQFESADPHVVSCQLHDLEAPDPGEPTVRQHRFLALSEGVTAVTQPATGQVWPVKVVSEQYVRDQQEVHRRVAMQEARKHAKWWGQSPVPHLDSLGGEPLKSPGWGRRRLLRKEAAEKAKKHGTTIGGSQREGAWRKPLERRSSVDGMDMFDVISPLLAEEPCTPAKEYWCLDALDYCLRSGRSPSSWSGPKTPLRTCVVHNRKDVVELLLRRTADPDECNEKGVSVLHLAVWYGRLEVCKKLLEYGAEPNVQDRQGSTPFFFAKDRGTCKLLLEAMGELETTNHRGQTPLHFACRAANAEVLQWMGRHASKTLREHRDDFGAKASYYAHQAGMDQRWLVKIGVKAAA